MINDFFLFTFTIISIYLIIFLVTIMLIYVELNNNIYI